LKILSDYDNIFIREFITIRGGTGRIIKRLRINEMIKAKEVRLIDEQGELLGVMPVPQARKIAEEQGLDLVEVAAAAVPPVCRLMDYGKFKYDQTKKEREVKKAQKVSDIKEIRLRPKIGDHDYEAKARVARKALENGDKVKVTIVFRGRENTHPEIGLHLLKQMMDEMADIASVEGQPTRLGSRVHIMLIPKSNKGTAKKQAAPETANIIETEIKEEDS